MVDGDALTDDPLPEARTTTELADSRALTGPRDADS
jgi:hypothetical protein